MDTVPAGNDTTGASGTGPVLEYSLKLMCFILFIFVLILNTSTCFVSLTMVMEVLFIYMFNFGTKICTKMPICRTIQKPESVNRFLVASFASSIKPPPFTGSNYKRWRERAILWFTVMRVMFVTVGCS